MPDAASREKAKISLFGPCSNLEEAMPHYEYHCQACNKKFSLTLTLAEHDESKIKCPKCGSIKVEQQWAAFYATTSKKS